MIEALKGFPANVAAFACHGHVSRADYETVLIPDLEKRLVDHDKVRIYYEIAPDFSGIDAGAAWEDAKVGVTHLLRWERFAVVTDVEWIKHAVTLVGFLMPGHLRIFTPDEAQHAREWVEESG